METRVAACSFFLGGFVLILVCLLFGGFFFAWFVLVFVWFGFFNCWLKGALMTACSFPLVVFTPEIAEFKAPNWTSC